MANMLKIFLTNQKSYIGYHYLTPYNLAEIERLASFGYLQESYDIDEYNVNVKAFLHYYKYQTMNNMFVKMYNWINLCKFHYENPNDSNTEYIKHFTGKEPSYY